MAKKREPESRAVTEARVELAVIVGELRAAKTRALAIARRLKAAGRTVEPTGYLGGEPWTEEAWLASHIHGTIVDGDFDEVVDSLRGLARRVRWMTLAGEVASRTDRAARRAARQGIAVQTAV